MTRDRYDRPQLDAAGGPGGWSDRLNDNFADLGIEIIKHVPTWADLPAPGGETSSEGQATAYLVLEDAVFVVDDTTNDEWVVVGGLGRDAHSLPAVTADDATVNNAPTTADDVARKQEVDAVQSNVETVQSNVDDHNARHESDGADEIDATGLSVGQQTTDDHSARHESGGADEISVAGLSGDLADPQDPESHATSHHDGGSDELDAADLGGASGLDGQFLFTNGATASWQDLPEGVTIEQVRSESLIWSEGFAPEFGG